MNRLLIFSTLIFSGNFLAKCSCEKDVDKNKTEKSKPNVILIMADDLGYSDIGCYGGEIQTPNLDSLANEGVSFTQFYNGARSSPTRASILTGLYAHQVGMGHLAQDLGYSSYSGELSQDAPTIAKLLKSSGYNTYMTGKWHLTKNSLPDTPTDINNRPLDRGFDHFYGTLPGHGSYWNPAGLMEDSAFVKAQGDYYYTEALADYASKYIQDAVSKKSPFFLYFAPLTPHYPLHAREKYIRKYEDLYKQGWEQLREERMDFLKKQGLIPENTEIPPLDELSGPWEKEEYKEWQAHRMAVYAAMVEQMDIAIGQIIKILKETGQYNNSLIMFLSDNGASAEGHLYNTIERQGNEWNSNVIPEKTRDGHPVKSGDWPGKRLGSPDTYGSYGPKWANLSNTPFRLFKSWVHEGGISTPFIVSWPDVIPKGETTSQVAHIIDILPTILDVTDTEYPKSFNQTETTSLQGISLLPYIKNIKKNTERTLFWEHEGNRAIRKGDWKLVSEYLGSWSSIREYTNSGKWELYNMEDDRTEMNDRSKEHPNLVKELSSEWQRWADSVGVVKWKHIEKQMNIQLDRRNIEKLKEIWYK